MIKYNTVNELMTALGCEKWPERWAEFYTEVASDPKAFAGDLIDPAYYDMLHEKYGILVNLLELYKAAAVKVGENEDLMLFTALLNRAMRDRSCIMKDIASLSFPTAPEGEDTTPYDMIKALVMCPSIPVFYEDMKKRDLPEDVIVPSILIMERVVEAHMKKNDGRPGFSNFDWHQLAYDGKLYRVNNLVLEFPARFPGIATVYQNTKGETVALASNVRFHRDGLPLGSKSYEDEEGAWTAEITEDDEAYTGYPYVERGFVSKTPVTLKKSEWTPLFGGGALMISLHIPAKVNFSEEEVDKTIAYSREILAKHFPDYEYKTFFCASWLLNEQLADILGDDANTVKFCRRFKRIAMKDHGYAVFSFVFNVPTTTPVNELPEDTKLRRGLKQIYLDGKYIHQFAGYFL